MKNKTPSLRDSYSNQSNPAFLDRHATLAMTISLLTFFLTSVIYHPTSILAADSTITAIPPRLILSANSGGSITSQLKVRNGSDVAENYLVTVQDFVVYDTAGTPIPVATSVSNRWSLASWITAPELIPVDAKATQTVNIKINIPRTALPGGHYAMITYMPNGESKPGDLKKTASLIGQRVGTLIYFTVSGPVKEQVNITKFDIPRFTENGPVSITGTLESLSDVHVSPQGSVTIFDPLNTKVAELPVDFGNIFPETSRDFTSLWNQKWGWGRYRANLNVSYGTTGAVATATIFFWLFPIRLVIIVLVAIISILTVIILLNKRSKRHQEQLEKEVRQLKQELEHIETK